MHDLYPPILAATDDGGSGVVGLVIIVVVIAMIARLFKGGKPSNRCPKCGKDSLEKASHWWHGSHVRCKHTWMCGWSELQQREARKRQREYENEAPRRRHLEEEERRRQIIIDNQIERNKNRPNF